MTTEQFILEHRYDDTHVLALQRSRYPEVDIDFAVRQISGWQTAVRKLPTISQIDGWWYPVHLSMEQCSSEQTALYKAQLIERLSVDYDSFADLTGGAGIDCFFMSRGFRQAFYVERNAELCRLAEHNYSTTDRNITVVNQTAEDFISGSERVEVIYLDPARRDMNGNKVVSLHDCSPDVAQMYSALMNHCRYLVLKLSPMLDFNEIFATLPSVSSLHVVALNGEVKELLLILSNDAVQPTITAVDLASNLPPFDFTLQQERDAVAQFATEPLDYIYCPSAAILKAGAYKLLSERFGLLKFSQNSHIYTSNRLVEHFPGRIFRFQGYADKKKISRQHYAVISRNHPLSAQQIRQRFRLSEDEHNCLIATRLADTPVLLESRKISACADE